jgi:hypothetical protein
MLLWLNCHRWSRHLVIVSRERDFLDPDSGSILREGSFILGGGIVIGLLLAIATGKILNGILY